MNVQQKLRFPDHVNVAIVGAGPAGLGVARVLRDLGIPDVWVLERGKIGQSFLDWPDETRLLTPSFAGNVFGVTDLNAMSFDSSPGWSLKREHPDGKEYALYLSHAARAFGINVQSGVEIMGLTPDADHLTLHTELGDLDADFVIWACGQFGVPSSGGLPGADLARHYANVGSWGSYPGKEVYVIGGYEAGIDAAIGLAQAGKEPIVLDRGAPWLDGDKDPSRALSPYTLQRLHEARQSLPITLLPDADIISIEEDVKGIHILAGDGRSWLSEGPPVLATGFGSGTGPASDWFEYDNFGLPMLTPQDESVALPGLFLVGPEVSHNGYLFCFIYKFRQRFAVVAQAIAGRMGVDTGPLEEYRFNNMFLDDLSCCDDDKCLC